MVEPYLHKYEGENLEKILQREIDKIYGMEIGKRSGEVLIPAFLGDFRKVLEKSDAGKMVSEEYMTEDKKIHLILKGIRKFGPMGMEMVVASCIFNDSELLTAEVRI